MSDTLQERIVKSRLKLLRKSPFFGTLLLHAPYVSTESIPTAATDGNTLLFNPKWAESISGEEFTGVLVHEVLHAALKHVPRMQDVFLSDPAVANMAGDIVVNGILDDNNIALPKGCIRDDKLKHLSVREIYNILKQNLAKDPKHLEKEYGVKTVNACFVKPGESGSGKNKQQSGKPGDQPGQGGEGGDQPGQEGEGEGDGDGIPKTSEGDVDWDDVLTKASTIARMKKAGPKGAAMERIFQELLEPTIDWRTILYKYITECRNDFDGYDRRFTYRNLYVDDFTGAKVNVLVYIDVSGSVDEKLLTEFMSEIHGAIAAVPNIYGEVHCFDTRLHYVCQIEDIATEFKLIGGGGTCFRPIFKHIHTFKEENLSSDSSMILPIILTDGYADLNDHPHTDPLLWAISPGGLDSHHFPFGEVVRITT